MRTKIASMKYLLCFIAAVMMFGSSGIVASTLPLSAFEVCLMRLIIGALSMGLIFVVTRQRLPRHVGRRQYLFVALSGACLGLAMMTIFTAYRLLGVGLGAVLAATAPVITMALSPLLFKERLRFRDGRIRHRGRRPAFAECVRSGGHAVGSRHPHGTRRGRQHRWHGHLQQARPRHHRRPLHHHPTRHGGGGGPRRGRGWRGLRLHRPYSLELWPTVIALGAVFTALAYFLYYRAIDQLPMQTVSVCAYAEPLTAVVLGALVLGEVMTPVQLAGACCIIGGALLGEARVKLPAAQRRRMRRAYVRLVRAQRRVLHHAA